MPKYDWDLFRALKDYEIDLLKRYIELMENQFEEAKKSGHLRLQRAPGSFYDEDEMMELEIKRSDYEYQFNKYYPSYLHYSFIVLVYIFFENNLREICNEIARRKNFKIKEKDLRGSAVERAKTFLKKVAEAFPEDDPLWESLMVFQKVRDCIVHANGRVEESKDKKDLKRISKLQCGIKIEEGHLIIDSQYCTNLINKIGSFFEHVFELSGFGPVIPIISNNQDQSD